MSSVPYINSKKVPSSYQIKLFFGIWDNAKEIIWYTKFIPTLILKNYPLLDRAAINEFKDLSNFNNLIEDDKKNCPKIDRNHFLKKIVYIVWYMIVFHTRNLHCTIPGLFNWSFLWKLLLKIVTLCNLTVIAAW